MKNLKIGDLLGFKSHEIVWSPAPSGRFSKFHPHNNLTNEMIAFVEEISYTVASECFSD